MAELTDPTAQTTSNCCAPEVQQTCCEPSEKASCCDSAAGGSSCGCAAGQSADANTLRDTVRARYAAAALAASGQQPSSCCGNDAAVITDGQVEQFGAALYEDNDRSALPDTAVLASLGCGNPTAVAELHEGETVLDLGSGGGIDVLLSARRVGPTGTAYGLDMTDEMLELAHRNAREAGLGNIEFLKGEIEAVPLPDASVDVVISNCVINLSGDKPRVLREAARVLRPGGRFAVSDVIADEDMDEATRSDMKQWTGCVAGALTRREFEQSLRAAGLADVDIAVTHRVHEHAASAIVRARRPAYSHEFETARRNAERRALLDGR